MIKILTCTILMTKIMMSLANFFERNLSGEWDRRASNWRAPLNNSSLLKSFPCLYYSYLHTYSTVFEHILVQDIIYSRIFIEIFSEIYSWAFYA